LPKNTQPKAEEMKFMSLYLKTLECIKNLSPSVLRLLHSTSIFKLLKAIKNQQEIPRDDEFDFKGRSVKLLEKWKEIADSKATRQPIDNHSTGLTNEQKDTTSPDSQQPLDNKTITSPTSLTEEYLPKIIVKSGQSIERLIDLIDDDDNKSETTDYPSIEPDVAKRAQTIGSPIQKDQASPKSDSAKSNSTKRKRFDTTDDKRVVSALDSCKMYTIFMKFVSSRF